MTPVDELRRRASRAGEAKAARGAASGPRPPTAVVSARGPTRRKARGDALLDGSGITLLRLGVDAVALTVAVVITLHWPGEPVSLRRGWLLLALVPLTMLMFAARDLYRAELWSSLLDGVRPVIGAVSVATMFVVLAIIYLGGNSVEPGVVAHAWLLSLLLLGIGRTAVVVAQRNARTHGLTRPTLIVGAGAVGDRLADRLVGDPAYGMTPIGFLDARPPRRAAGGRLPVLGGPDDLEAVAAATGARHVLVAFSAASDRSLLPLVRRAREAGLEIAIVPRMFESLNDRLVYQSLGGIPLLGLRGTDPHGWRFQVKHAIDRGLAALALIALSPVMLAVALAVRASSPGPVLFRQPRVGRDGRVFELLKYRSMRAPRREPGFRLPAGLAPGGVEGEDRRTGVGRLLRRTSLDELPQLINVLRGDMSLVGPRPERPEFAEQFRADIERYGDRQRVRAGMTGWAQVHGLSGRTSIEDRSEWDNYYIEHWSLGLDLKVLVLTVKAVLIKAE